MSTILVTGGNGFIGAHLVDALDALGKHKITVLDVFPRPFGNIPRGINYIQGDLANGNFVRNLLKNEAIDIVYHLAWSTIHETALQNPAADVESNLIPSINLLDASASSGVRHFIYLSSGGTVYGNPEKTPVPESAPLNPINAYGITKLTVEHYVRMFSYLRGLPFTIFRPSVPYGPYQNPHRRQGAVSVFIYRALRNQPVIIWGDGKATRDYFYIEDLTRALLSALSVPDATNQTINLGGKISYSLNELVTSIENVLGLKIQIRYEASRQFDVPHLQLDISAAERILSWQPKTTLLRGIEKTAEWIRTIKE
ncbi:MAG: NAD-dependent epimerase/dehydratase family protein [Anaerolineales bacterium]